MNMSDTGTSTRRLNTVVGNLFWRDWYIGVFGRVNDLVKSLSKGTMAMTLSSYTDVPRHAIPYSYQINNCFLAYSIDLDKPLLTPPFEA